MTKNYFELDKDFFFNRFLNTENDVASQIAST